MTTPIRLAMIGGGRDAFIGAVHRKAAALDARFSLVAGCLSSSPEKALASGRDLGLSDERNYPTWRALLDSERARPADDRAEAVAIVTPNHTHHEIARASIEAGFHVICDKPLCHTSAQAGDLADAVARSGLVFAVTYNYSGYPMVKQARRLVRDGVLGPIRKVIVEYNQGWLASNLEASGQKQADWRTDPARSGLGGAIGDIGSHAEQLVAYVTGLELDAICADLTTFVKGRRLDDDANLLLRFKGGARGILTASQIEIGCENDLRLRVWGERGGLDWRQEDPNHLVLHALGEPERVFRRGNDYLAHEARLASRLPSGHPEAFIEAFANVYLGVAHAIRAGDSAPARSGGLGAATAPAEAPDFPSIHDGVRGVRFIEQAVLSSASERKWTPFKAP